MCSSALRPGFEGAERLGVPKRARNLLQEAGEVQVLLRLPSIKDDDKREVRLRPRQVVCALDLVIIEVHHFVQSVEFSCAVSHHHDNVGPVRERALSRWQ